MSTTKFKVALNQGAKQSVNVFLRDERGADKGDAKELKPGSETGVELKEGEGLVLKSAEKVADAQEDISVSVAVEKGSKFKARVQLMSQGGQMSVQQVGPEEHAGLNLLDDSHRIVVDRGDAV